MPDSPTDGVRKAIAAAAPTNNGLQTEAMVLGDTNALEDLLDEGFTLAHMTGDVQSKAEWLADIDADRMHYDVVDTVETLVTFERETTVLTARSIASTW